MVVLGGVGDTTGRCHNISRIDSSGNLQYLNSFVSDSVDFSRKTDGTLLDVFFDQAPEKNTRGCL